MTPDRIEEIKKKYRNMDYFTMQHTFGLLLATLEETEQQLVRKTDELTEAQQTIARLTAALIAERDAALTWDGTGTVKRINEALREGAKEDE